MALYSLFSKQSWLHPLNDGLQIVVTTSCPTNALVEGPHPSRRTSKLSNLEPRCQLLDPYQLAPSNTHNSSTKHIQYKLVHINKCQYIKFECLSTTSTNFSYTYFSLLVIIHALKLPAKYFLLIIKP